MQPAFTNSTGMGVRWWVYETVKHLEGRGWLDATEPDLLNMIEYLWRVQDPRPMFRREMSVGVMNGW
jgi:hypothetical protein